MFQSQTGGDYYSTIPGAWKSCQTPHRELETLIQISQEIPVSVICDFFWRARFSVKVRKHHSIMPVRILEGPCLNVVCSTNATLWTNRDPELGLMNNGTMIRSVASTKYHRIASRWQCLAESARCQDHLKQWRMTVAKSNWQTAKGHRQLVSAIEPGTLRNRRAHPPLVATRTSI